MYKAVFIIFIRQSWNELQLIVPKFQFDAKQLRIVIIIVGRIFIAVAHSAQYIR